MSNKKRRREEDEEEEEELSTSVTINVGGTKYTVATDTIMKYPETMLGSLLSKRWEKKSTEDGEEVFLDRDPVRFRYILDFYRDGTITIPCTMSREEMLREAQYFALPIKDVSEIQLSDLASLRSSITNVEDTLIGKFQQEARKRVAVACAYELAALHMDKLRKGPGALDSVELRQNEIPETSFARVLCPHVLDDPEFKKTIKGLVGQAGYYYRGEINHDRLHLSRHPGAP